MSGGKTSPLYCPLKNKLCLLIMVPIFQWHRTWLLEPLVLIISRLSTRMPNLGIVSISQYWWFSMWRSGWWFIVLRYTGTTEGDLNRTPRASVCPLLNISSPKNWDFLHDVLNLRHPDFTSKTLSRPTENPALGWQVGCEGSWQELDVQASWERVHPHLAWLRQVPSIPSCS